MKDKSRKRTRRGAHYRALAEGYSIMNPSIAESFRHAADYYDNTDPPLETEAEVDELGKTPVEQILRTSRPDRIR